MNAQGFMLAGELKPWPSKEVLVRVLTAHGLTCLVGPYAVRLPECEHFAFQNYGGDRGEPMIDADASTLKRLRADARRVSETLAASNITHRFEIYGDAPKVILTYLHHNWPQ